MYDPDEDAIILNNKAWVLQTLVDMPKVRQNYLIWRYDEVGCAKCEYSHERGKNKEAMYICDTCPAFLGKYKLYEVKEIDGRKYVGLHLGDKLKFSKKAGLSPRVLENVDDRRATPKLKYDISFTGKLRDHQKDALKQLKANGYYGQLMAPPRSGKTVLAVRVTLRLGLKTLILVHQGDLLDQMLQSFYDFTDIKDVEFEHKKQLIGIAKKIEDFSKWPIVLSTYQKFITPKGKLKLKKVRRKFGLVMIDECHKIGADCFSQVLSSFESKHRLGFTATPKRKDCFIKGTLVLLSNGEYAPIEQIVANPTSFSVKTCNTVTKSLEESTVLEGHIRHNSKLIKIKYNGDDILCTPDELFWSKTRNAYVKAKSLKIGEELLDISEIS